MKAALGEQEDLTTQEKKMGPQSVWASQKLEILKEKGEKSPGKLEVEAAQMMKKTEQTEAAEGERDH